MYTTLNEKQKKSRPFSGFSFRKRASKECTESFTPLQRDPRDEKEGFAFEFPMLCARLGASNIPQVMIIDPETNQPVSPLTKPEEYEVKSSGNDRSLISNTVQMSQLSTTTRTSQSSQVSNAKCVPPIPFVIAYFDDDKKQENLRKLVFKGFTIDDEIMKALGTAMIWNNTLETLDLQETHLTAKLLRHLALFLSNPNTRIHNLNLDKNPIPEQNYNVVLKSSGLLNLSLRKCGITDLGAREIAEELKFKDAPDGQTLRYLNLSHNNLGDEGMRYLAECLRTNRTLEELVLSQNDIGDAGAINLASVTAKFPLNTQELSNRKRRNLDRITKSSAMIEEKLHSLLEAREIRSAGSQRSKRASALSVSSEDRQQIQRQVIRQMDYDTHPYSWDVRPEGLDMWCIGNFHLKEINLANNQIGVRGAQKLLETLQYQKIMREKENKRETGLRNINLQGNLHPDKCPALGKIQEILTVDLREKYSPSEYRRLHSKKHRHLCPRHTKDPNLPDRVSCEVCLALRDSQGSISDEIPKKEERQSKKSLKSMSVVTSFSGKRGRASK